MILPPDARAVVTIETEDGACFYVCLDAHRGYWVGESDEEAAEDSPLPRRWWRIRRPDGWPPKAAGRLRFRPLPADRRGTLVRAIPGGGEPTEPVTAFEYRSELEVYWELLPEGPPG